MENNETLKARLADALCERVNNRLFEVLNDAIGDELVELMNETAWVSELSADEQDDLAYETFNRIYLGYN